MCVVRLCIHPTAHLFPQLGQVPGVVQTGDSVRQLEGASPLNLGMEVLDTAFIVILATGEGEGNAVNMVM